MTRVASGSTCGRCFEYGSGPGGILLKPTRPLIVILLITAAHYFHHQLTALVVPLLPFMRDGFELSYTQAGSLVSAFALSYGIGQLPAGWLADRIGPRYLLLAGISGVALAGILVGLSQSYPALIVFLVVMGIMGGGYHPSATPIISMTVPPEQRGRAVGIHLVGGSASHLVAPLLGVAIAGFLGWRGSFLVIAVPVLLLGVVVFIVFGRFTFADTPARVSPIGAAPVGDAIPRGADGQLVDSRNPGTRRSAQVPFFVAMTAVVAALTASMIAFVPLFLVDVLGVGESRAALGLALLYSTGLWAAPLGGFVGDRLGPLAVFAVATGLTGPLIILFAINGSVVIAMVLLLFIGIALFVRMTVSESFLVDAVPAARRSTVLGVYFFAGMEGSGIVTPILGNLIDRFGFRVAFSVSGIVLMVALASLAVAGAWYNRTVATGGITAIRDS